jgi:hypothetical protein
MFCNLGGKATMSDFVKWLIGLRELPSDASEGSWHIEFQSIPYGTTAIVYVGLFVAALAGVWWLYRLEKRDLRLPVRLFLVALRSLIVAAVVVMLLDMVLVIDRYDKIPSHLVVLMDSSESMALTDPYANEGEAKRIAKTLDWGDLDPKAALQKLRETKRYDLAGSAVGRLQKSLGEGREISVYYFDSKAEKVGKWDDLASLTPHGPQTAIGDALNQALSAHRGQPLAGILLITDGQSNGGEEPRKVAEQAGKQGVVIHSLAMGTLKGPSNVKLAELETSPVVFVRDPIKLAAVVESQGLQGQTALVRLERRKENGEWAEIGQSQVTLGEDSAVQRAEFDYTPEMLGQVDFRATVFDAGQELTEADNTATQTVKVIRQRIHVLLIADNPSPEIQFLRNSLLRDNGMEFSSWLQSAGASYEQVGHKPLKRLPANAQELNQYDVIILSDPDMRQLGPTWSEMLSQFVGDAGGGLIYIAGELNTPRLLDAASDPAARPADVGWLRCLPVVCEPGLYQSEAASAVRISAQNAWNLELSSEGGDDPIFTFAPDANKNKEVLASLPGMYWHFPVTRAKSGATVLAQHGDPRMRNSFGRHVLFAMQRYGPGRAVFIGFDSTYRWRYLHEEYFDGFWARMIDRVGRSKVLGGRYPFLLSTDRNVYRVGDRVTAKVQLLPGLDDANFASQLRGDVEAPGMEPIPLEFEPSRDRPDVLEASFQAEKGGAYMLRVAPGASGEEKRPSVRRRCRFASSRRSKKLKTRG